MFNVIHTRDEVRIVKRPNSSSLKAFGCTSHFRFNGEGCCLNGHQKVSQSIQVGRVHALRSSAESSYKDQSTMHSVAATLLLLASHASGHENVGNLTCALVAKRSGYTKMNPTGNAFFKIQQGRFLLHQLHLHHRLFHRQVPRLSPRRLHRPSRRSDCHNHHLPAHL